MKHLTIILALIVPMFCMAQTEFVNVQLPFDCEDYQIEGKKIDVLPDGNYFFLCQLTFGGFSYPCTIILDPWGNTLNAQYYSEGYTAFSYTINPDAREVYISGWETDHNAPSPYLNAVDFSGNLIWEEDIDISDATQIGRAHV